MNHKHIAIPALVLILGAGCASTDSARTARAEFEDVPVPSGLTYLEKDSIIVDAPGAKVARMLYRGRVQMSTLAMSIRGTLENNGWRKVGSSTTTAEGTTQVYEKERSSLQVRLWENFLFTYVEVTTSRLTDGGMTAPAVAPGPLPMTPGGPTSSIASPTVAVSGPSVSVPPSPGISVSAPSVTPPVVAAPEPSVSWTPPAVSVTPAPAR